MQANQLLRLKCINVSCKAKRLLLLFENPIEDKNEPTRISRMMLTLVHCYRDVYRNEQEQNKQVRLNWF